MGKKINLTSIQNQTKSVQAAKDEPLFEDACEKIDSMIDKRSKDGEHTAKFILDSSIEHLNHKLASEYGEFEAAIGYYEGCPEEGNRGDYPYHYITFAW